MLVRSNYGNLMMEERYKGNVVWWIGSSGGNDGRSYSNTVKETIKTPSAVQGGPNTIVWVDLP
jgi:hypothetical protein